MELIVFYLSFSCNISISDITDITLVFDIVNFPWVDDLADNSSIIFKSYAGRFCRDVSSYLHIKHNQKLHIVMFLLIVTV